MNGPLKPGSSWQAWEVQQVLSWGQGGGLYRVAQGQKKRLLKELIVSEPQRDRVVQAAVGWQKLSLPQAIPLEEVTVVEGRVYLLMPELPGQPVSLGRTARPPEELLLKWAQQICDLVLVLQHQQNPLALVLLEPDHILVDALGELVVFNPGWSSSGALTASQGLHKFARLMVFCATGSPLRADKLPSELPPAFLWMVSRCLHDEYTSFSQLRQSLQTVALEESRPSRSRQQALDDFSISDLPNPPVARPLSRRLALGLALLSLLALLGLGLGLRRGQAKYSQPAGLALARGNRLVWLTPEGATLAESQLPQAINCMLSSPDGAMVLLGIEGKSGVTLVDRARREAQQVEGGAPPAQLLFSSNHQRIVGLLKNGNLGHWKWTEGKLRWLGEVSWTGFVRGAQLAAVRDDGAALLLLPGRGVVLIDAQGSENLSHAGVTAALFLDQLVVAADARLGRLLTLGSDLQPLAQQKLAGLTQLYRDSYRRQLWAVEQRGLVTLWSVPGLERLGQVQMEGPPLGVAPDPLGHLWMVTENGRLYKLDSHPLSGQQLGQVGECTGLVYLAPPQTLKPSQI